jgi:hypothetical protein
MMEDEVVEKIDKALLCAVTETLENLAFMEVFPTREILPSAWRGMGGTAMTEPRRSAAVTGVVFKADPG